MGLKLVGEVSLDGSGFERGLEQIGHAATHNLKNLIAGAFGVYSIHQVIHRTVEAAEELVTASKRLDIVPERLQVLRQAAKENNAEFSKLVTKFDELNVSRQKALAGGAEGAKIMKAFGDLGVTPEMLRTQSAANLFMGPLSTAARTRSVQDIDAPMKEIFRRGFGELIPVLKTDFDELGAKMRALGSIMDTDTAVAVKHLKDEFDLLSNIIVAQTAPALVEFAKLLINITGKVGATGSFFGAGSTWIRPDQIFDAIRKFALSPILGGLATYQAAKQFDPNAAANAYSAQQDVWNKIMLEMQAKIDAAAEALKNPPAPGGEDPMTAQKRAASLKSGDSLVSVGNFLGSTGVSLQRMNERKIQLLTQIANNTKPKPLPPATFLPPILVP